MKLLAFLAACLLIAAALLLRLLGNGWYRSGAGAYDEEPDFV